MPPQGRTLVRVALYFGSFSISLRQGEQYSPTHVGVERQLSLLPGTILVGFDHRTHQLARTGQWFARMLRKNVTGILMFNGLANHIL
jgi:hypothetical protein